MLLFDTVILWFQLLVYHNIFAYVHINMYFIVSEVFILIFVLFFFDLIIVLFLIWSISFFGKTFLTHFLFLDNISELVQSSSIGNVQ